MVILDTDHMSILQRGGAASLNLSLKLSSCHNEEEGHSMSGYGLLRIL
jgi:hypothetical protein